LKVLKKILHYIFNKYNLKNTMIITKYADGPGPRFKPKPVP